MPSELLTSLPAAAAADSPARQAHGSVPGDAAGRAADFRRHMDAGSGADAPKPKAVASPSVGDAETDGAASDVPDDGSDWVASLIDALSGPDGPVAGSAAVLAAGPKTAADAGWTMGPSLSAPAGSELGATEGDVAVRGSPGLSEGGPALAASGASLDAGRPIADGAEAGPAATAPQRGATASTAIAVNALAPATVSPAAVAPAGGPWMAGRPATSLVGDAVVDRTDTASPGIREPGRIDAAATAAPMPTPPADARTVAVALEGGAPREAGPSTAVEAARGLSAGDASAIVPAAAGMSDGARGPETTAVPLGQLRDAVSQQVHTLVERARTEIATQRRVDGSLTTELELAPAELGRLRLVLQTGERGLHLTVVVISTASIDRFWPTG